jgi:3-oxoacyl-[acyl-carrier-protein] synthase III
MAAGLPLRLSDWESRLAPGARVLLAAAGPGFSWGAAALELG